MVTPLPTVRSSVLDPTQPTEEHLNELKDFCVAVVVSKDYCDMEVFHERLMEFLQDEIDQGVQFLVSANDVRTIEYLKHHGFRHTVLPIGQEKTYIKKYAVLLFVAVCKQSKAIFDWINNCPMYGPQAPVCLLVKGDAMFEINSHVRIYGDRS